MPVVTAIVWFLTTGISLLLDPANFSAEKALLRRATNLCGPATIVAAFSNVAILGLSWELVLVPILFIIGSMLAISRSESNVQIPAIVPTMASLACLTVVLLIVVMRLVDDPATWENLVQAFLLPIWLTIGSLLYLKILTVVEREAFLLMAKSTMVSKEQYAADWPLTTDSARLCYKDHAVWIEVDKKRYGLNGRSRTVLPTVGIMCSELDDIRRNDPVIGGVKVSLSRLIQDGLAFEGTD